MATPFIATVAIGTALDIRGFAVGVGKLRSAASAINGPIGKSNLAVRSFNRGLGGAELGLQAVSTAGRAAVGIVDGVGQALMKVGRQASVLSLVAGLVGVSVVKSGFEWRKTWNQARAVTAGTTDEMERLEELVFELGAKTKFTVPEVAGAVDFLGKAGNNAVEQLSLLPTMLDLAAAAGTDLPRTADIMTNIAQGLGIPLERVAEHGDMLTSTFLNSNVTLEMLADSLKKLGPVARVLDIPFDQLVTSIGLMGNAGIQGSEAGVHLRRVWSNLSDSMNNMRSEVVKMLGIDWSDLDITTRGMVPVLNDLANKLLDDSGKILSQEHYGLAVRLFGQRAISTTLALLHQLRDGYDDLSDSVENSAGAMRDTAAAQLEGLEPFYRLQAAWELVKIRISESGVLETFANLGDKLAGLLNKFSDTTDETKRLVFGILTIATIAGPTIFAFGLMVSAVANVGKVLLFLGSVIGFILTPVGLLTAAILTIVGAAAYMGAKGVESFQSLWDGSSPLIEALTNIILSAVGAVAAIISGDWALAWDYAKDLIVNTAVVVMTVLTHLVNTMIRLLKDISSFVATNWEEIAASTQEALEWLFTSTEGWLVVFTLLLFRGFRNMAIGVVSRVAWMATQIVLLFIALGKRLGLGTLVSGVWGGIWSGLTMVATTGAKGILAVMRKFGKLFLTVFLTIGTRIAGWGLFAFLIGAFKAAFMTVLNATAAFGRNLAGWIVRYGPKLAGRVTRLVYRFINPWVGAIATILELIYIFREDLWNGIKGLGSVVKAASVIAVEWMVNNWIDGFNKILDGFESLVRKIVGGYQQLKDEAGIFGIGVDVLETVFGFHDDLLQLANFTLPGRVGHVDLDPNGPKSIAEAWKEGSGGLGWSDFGETAKAFWDDFKKPFEEAWKALTGIGAESLDFFEEAIKPMAELYTDIAEGDWEAVGEKALGALDDTIGKAFRFLADVASDFATGVLDPALKAGIEATLGGLGFVFKKLDIAIQSIGELEDVDPEKIKRNLYSLLEGLKGPDAPIFGNEAEQFQAEADLAAAKADTPEERKKAAIDFIHDLIASLRGTIESIFKVDESGKPTYTDADQLAHALETQGYNLDQLKNVWSQLESEWPDSDTYTPSDEDTGLDPLGGGGGGVSRSLSGTLSDLSLRVLVQIGDQPFEDAVVESLFRARRGGRLEGLTT